MTELGWATLVTACAGAAVFGILRWPLARLLDLRPRLVMHAASSGILLLVAVFAITLTQAPSLEPIASPVLGESSIQAALALDQLAPWLGAAAAAGMIWWSMGLLIAARRIRRLVRRARRCDVRHLLGRQDDDARINVRLSKDVQTPCVIGCWRPTVLMPVAALRRLQPNELAAILAHECAHIRRRDPLGDLLARLVRAPICWHPTVLWLARVLERSRERCRDDDASRNTGDRRTLALALLQLARSMQPDARLQPGLGASTDVARRIERLLVTPSERKPAKRNWAQTATAASVLVLGFVSSGAAWLARSEAAHTRAVGDAPWLEMLGSTPGVLRVPTGTSFDHPMTNAGQGCLLVLPRGSTLRQGARRVHPGDSVSGTVPVTVEQASKTRTLVVRAGEDGSMVRWR